LLHIQQTTGNIAEAVHVQAEKAAARPAVATGYGKKTLWQRKI
jgi:hypothetical protein